MEFNGTFLVTIISFLVFVFLMNQILYEPMRKIMAQRQEFIDGNLNTAGENHKKAEELSKERQDKLDDAKNEARSKYVETVNGFKTEKSEIIANAQDETNHELNQHYENLKRLSDETKDGLKGRMTDLANDIVEKVLGYRSEVQGFNEDDVNKALWG